MGDIFEKNNNAPAGSLQGGGQGGKLVFSKMESFY